MGSGIFLSKVPCVIKLGVLSYFKVGKYRCFLLKLDRTEEVMMSAWASLQHDLPWSY